MMSGKSEPKIPAVCPCPAMNILFQKFCAYFNINFLIKAFLIAISFSFFIYSKFFGFESKFLNTLFALSALFFILKAKPKELFFIGFFIGLFWFYWIGLSFRYYNLSWMIPIVIIFVGVVYGVLFWLMGKMSLFYEPFTKSIILTLFSYIHPFGFNWFIPELIFLESFLRYDKLSFFLTLLALSFIVYKRTKLTILAAMLILIFNFQGSYKKPKIAPLKIYLSQTKLPQDKKWNREYRKKIVNDNFKIINSAIKNGYDLVVLPESAFPLYLNLEDNLLRKLLKLSQKISIVTGALHYKDGNPYNSTYIFSNEKFKIIDKVVLVPFGEYIPLPKPIAKIVNRVFFDGASDYQEAKKPEDFIINKVKFRNAICYEATTELLYKDAPKQMIAISNNAWFTPSIEPTLQNSIIKFYARKYKMIVYHSTNIAKTEVIW